MRTPVVKMIKEHIGILLREMVAVSVPLSLLDTIRYKSGSRLYKEEITLSAVYRIGWGIYI